MLTPITVAGGPLLATVAFPATFHRSVPAVADQLPALTVTAVNGRACAHNQRKEAVVNDAINALATLPTVTALTRAFTAAGHRLFLVGGCVRDALLNDTADIADIIADLDFTTDAEVDTIEAVLAEVSAQSGRTGEPVLWLAGQRHGTIAALVHGNKVEVTRHRSDVYDDPETRQPTVVFGDSIEEDLARRDLTINAIALEVNDTDGNAHVSIVDPFGGAADLAAGVIRTPSGDPARTIREDPLRALRAVRFASRFGFVIDPELAHAITGNVDRLDILSSERIAEELGKVLKLGGSAAAFALRTADELGIVRHMLGGVTPDERLLAAIERLDTPAEMLAAIVYATSGEPLADPPAEADRLVRLGLGSRVDMLRRRLGMSRAAGARALGKLRFPNDVVASAVAAAALVGHAATLQPTRVEARRLTADVCSEHLSCAFRVAEAFGVPVSELETAVAEVEPQFTGKAPIDGNALLQAGLSGPAIRHGLEAVQAAWFADPDLAAEAAVVAALAAVNG